MATAKKLPSGSWRCLAYSHTERIYDEKTQKWKNKRIYESFTDDDPSPAGRKRAELAAAQFQASKTPDKIRKRQDYGKLTLSQAIDKYIESRENLNRSPTTLQDYRCIQKNAFPDLMDTPIKDIDITILQEALSAEARRPANSPSKKGKPISAKRVRNEWGLIRPVLNKYGVNDLDFEQIELPTVTPRLVELPSAKTVLNIIKGTDIELPVLLAAWLSFSMSEVRGLTKSKSISGNCITIHEVVVDINNKPVRKELAKNPTRNRRLQIPPYIQNLIDQVDGDVLVPMSGRALYHRWIKLQHDNGMSPITFHDLRHLNASVMALLRIPDKYAQERGGWKTDEVMKRIYTQTFSDERVRVDNTIDNYFESIVNSEKSSADDKENLSPEELIKLFKERNPDGWYKVLENAMQHEMQHDTKKAR